MPQYISQQINVLHYEEEITWKRYINGVYPYA